MHKGCNTGTAQGMLAVQPLPPGMPPMDPLPYHLKPAAAVTSRACTTVPRHHTPCLQLLVHADLWCCSHTSAPSHCRSGSRPTSAGTCWPDHPRSRSRPAGAAILSVSAEVSRGEKTLARSVLALQSAQEVNQSIKRITADSNDRGEVKQPGTAGPARCILPANIHSCSVLFGFSLNSSTPAHGLVALAVLEVLLPLFSPLLGLALSQQALSPLQPGTWTNGSEHIYPGTLMCSPLHSSIHACFHTQPDALLLF